MYISTHDISYNDIYTILFIITHVKLQISRIGDIGFYMMTKAASRNHPDLRTLNVLNG